MKAWTDYPIAQLGDLPREIAPIREVEVLSYDRNKYCWVKICGTDVLDNFKSGYIYSKPGRCGDVDAVDVKDYEHLPTGIDDESDAAMAATKG